MLTRRVITLVSLIAILALGFTDSAGAQSQPPDWSDPATVQELSAQLAQAGGERDVLWAQLPSEARAAVVKYNTVVTVTSMTSANAPSASPVISDLMVSGCDAHYKSRSAYNYLGALLWEYWSNVEWCYNGSVVTSKFWTHGANVPWYSLWRWTRDAAGPSESGGVGQSSYRVWIEGEMKLEVAGYPLEVAYPWVDITVYGNGTSTSSAGG